MKITGNTTLHASRDRVWEALNDPEVLVRTIPGIQELRTAGQDSYQMTLTAGVASIKGTYLGNVRLTDQHAPDSFILHAAGSGAPGTVDAKVRVTLAEAGDSQTRLEYDADAAVGGMIGGVGQRVLAGVAKKTAGEFFQAVDDVLAGRAEVPAAAGGAPAAVPAPRAAAPEGVYRAPAAAPSARRPGSEFAKGAVFGAAVALLGAVIGGLLGRRRLAARDDAR
jgi:carbon monoxide dehydrogenase subunit G